MMGGPEKRCGVRYVEMSEDVKILREEVRKIGLCGRDR